MIDGTSNQLLHEFGVSTESQAFGYDLTYNKVYLGQDLMYPYVYVIDGHTDSVIGKLYVGSRPFCYCDDPLNGKVYAAQYGAVEILDSKRNGILRRIGGLPASWIFDFARNPVQNRVYAACNNSAAIAVLRDSIPEGVDEKPQRQASSGGSSVTIVRGVLSLPSPSVLHGASCVLLDISGRKVLDLKPGANDVRALAPGIYFVREQSQATSLKPQAVRKVVLTR